MPPQGSGFEIIRLGGTPEPQKAIYEGMHNDYAEDFDPPTSLSESRCGEIVVKRLLAGNRGHWGPLEHAHLVLKLKLDHNTVMQLRTHRIASFDVQSMRYTGDRILQVARRERSVREVFWIRPEGEYRDREGTSYQWTADDIEQWEAVCLSASLDYAALRDRGISEEHARGVLPTCYFQNVVISMNLRSWLHILEVRDKLDAQWEIQLASALIAGKVAEWAPEVYAWWVGHRRGKAILAP